jgi:hypothetical protein
MIDWRKMSVRSCASIIVPDTVDFVLMNVFVFLYIPIDLDDSIGRDRERERVLTRDCLLFNELKY